MLHILLSVYTELPIILLTDDQAKTESELPKIQLNQVQLSK